MDWRRRKKGKKEGRKEKLKEIIKNMLSKGKNKKEIMDLTGISEKDFDEANIN